MARLTTLVAVALLATVAIIDRQHFVANGARLLRDFKEILTVAEGLESSELLLIEKTEQVKRQRSEFIYVFARIAKGAICEKQYERLVGVADEYRIKAHNFVDENKNQPNWITNLIKLGGSQGAMRNLAKFDPYLNTITDRYVNQVKKSQISDQDIDCDVNKFQIRNLHAILFVLQTDIKYMLTEEQETINRAIYDQLKTDKFVSSSNFYELHELNSRQKELLLNYYSDRVNSDEKTVGQALDHYNNPSEYSIGRVIDSCQAVLKFETELNELAISFNDVCEKSSSDPNNKLFSSQYKFDKFDHTFMFCKEFLDAL